MARKNQSARTGNLTIANKNICTKLLYYLDMENASNFADGIARLCYIFLYRKKSGITDIEKRLSDMYIADLHTHSRYSRATSKECTPEYLDLWARRKGIHLIGSGDFTHPAWRERVKRKIKARGRRFMC